MSKRGRFVQGDDGHDDEDSGKDLATDDTRDGTFVVVGEFLESGIEALLETVRLRVVHDKGRQGGG